MSLSVVKTASTSLESRKADTFPTYTHRKVSSTVDQHARIRSLLSRLKVGIPLDESDTVNEPEADATVSPETSNINLSERYRVVTTSTLEDSLDSEISVFEDDNESDDENN